MSDGSYGISCQGTLMWESLVMGMTVGKVGNRIWNLILPVLISIIVNAVTKNGSSKTFTTPCSLYGIIQ